jgi:hypothetical protein
MTRRSANAHEMIRTFRGGQYRVDCRCALPAKKFNSISGAQDYYDRHVALSERRASARKR